MIVLDSSALLAIVKDEPLAKTSGFPLLFKGNDFSATDIASAV